MFLVLHYYVCDFGAAMISNVNLDVDMDLYKFNAAYVCNDQFLNSIGRCVEHIFLFKE